MGGSGVRKHDLRADPRLFLERLVIPFHGVVGNPVFNVSLNLLQLHQHHQRLAVSVLLGLQVVEQIAKLLRVVFLYILCQVPSGSAVMDNTVIDEEAFHFFLFGLAFGFSRRLQSSTESAPQGQTKHGPIIGVNHISAWHLGGFVAITLRPKDTASPLCRGCSCAIRSIPAQPALPFSLLARFRRIQNIHSNNRPSRESVWATLDIRKKDTASLLLSYVSGDSLALALFTSSHRPRMSMRLWDKLFLVSSANGRFGSVEKFAAWCMEAQPFHRIGTDMRYCRAPPKRFYLVQ